MVLMAILGGKGTLAKVHLMAGLYPRASGCPGTEGYPRFTGRNHTFSLFQTGQPSQSRPHLVRVVRTGTVSLARRSQPRASTGRGRFGLVSSIGYSYA